MSDRQRIDKWLWHARVVRTRSSAAAPADGDAARPQRQDRPRHDRQQHGRGGQQGQAEGGEKREGRPPQRERRGGGAPDRQDRDRQDRGPRREGGRRDFKDRDRGNQPREWRDPTEKRGGREADPNSPFAKLAALKAQLEGNKERT